MRKSVKIVGLCSLLLLSVHGANAQNVNITRPTKSTATARPTPLHPVKEVTLNPVVSFTVNGVSFRMIRVAGGTFAMGGSLTTDYDAFDNYEIKKNTEGQKTFVHGMTLGEVAAAYKEREEDVHHPRRIIVVGYADTRFSSPAYSQAIAERRAVFIKKGLVDMGVDGTKIEVSGQGGIMNSDLEQYGAIVVEGYKPESYEFIREKLVTKYEYSPMSVLLFVRPDHAVRLSSYSIGETEVTQELWEAVMGSNPSYNTGTKHPVEQVSWDECQTFIAKLNALTGKTFRLPTEAEWEFAARGGNRSRGYTYSGGNHLGSIAWYEDNSEDETHPVKTKSPNELGIYDMSGNVMEWCQDKYAPYNKSACTNPTGPSEDSVWADRVRRGGSIDDSDANCRSNSRSFYSPTERSAYLGLRLAM